MRRLGRLWVTTLPIDLGNLRGMARHPWLNALKAAPEMEVRRLLTGSAEIHGYGDVEPANAAASIFAGLDYARPEVKALETGLQAWFVNERAALARGTEEREDFVSQAIDAFEIISIVPLEALTLSLWRDYPQWYSWVENYDLAANADLRTALFRTLALTQARLPESMHERHIPFWLEIARRAGRDLPNGYIDLGLLGLKCLPLQSSEDGFLSNESLCVVALIEWIEGRAGMWSEFVRRWLALRHEYPHTAKHWADLFSAIVDRRGKEIPAEVKEAWRLNVGAPKIRAHQRGPAPLADLAEVDEFVDKLPRQNIVEAVARARQLVRYREKIAREYGNTEFAVKTACRVGREFLRRGLGPMRRRGEVALELAMTSLRWEPRHAHSWGLWRDSLVALGRHDDAEIVAWESVRRFPDDPVNASVLSSMLLERGSRRHAQALLEQTVDRTNDVVSKTMLAGLLMDPHGPVDYDEAERLLEEAMEDDPSDKYPPHMLALLFMRRSRKGDLENAERILRAYLPIDDPVTITMLAVVRLRSRSLEGWRDAKALLEGAVERSHNTYASKMLSDMLLRSGSRTGLMRAKELWPGDLKEGDKAAVTPPLPDELGGATEVEESHGPADNKPKVGEATDGKPTKGSSPAAGTLGSEEEPVPAGTLRSPAPGRQPPQPANDIATDDIVEQILQDFLGHRKSRKEGGVVKAARGAQRSTESPKPPPFGLDEAEVNLEAIRTSAEIARCGFLLAHGTKHEAQSAQRSLVRHSSKGGITLAKFMLLAFRPGYLADEEDEESSTFGLALLAALQNKSNHHVERLRARYPQEALICSVVDAQIVGETSKLRDVVSKFDLRRAGLLGPASRTYLHMSRAGRWDAHLIFGEKRIAAALAASFVVPLAA